MCICLCLIPSTNFAGQSHIAVQNQQNPGQAKGTKFKEFHPSNQSKPVNSNQQQAEVNQTQGTVGMVVDIQTSILLQTACAVVLKPTQPECSAVARILLDRGSQKTYITYDLKERLNLRPIKIEQVLIKTFGNDDEQLHQCEVVQICLKGMNSDLSLYVTADVVPTICSPLQNQAIEFAKEKYSQLCDLPLADIAVDNSDLEVGILIGSDYYWALTTGQIRRGEADPS